jgi:N-ethylmaleimide reductase
MEIVEQVSATIGADHLGVRLSPFGQYGGIHDSNPKELFSFIVKELNKRNIAYLHLIEARGSEMGLTDVLHESAVNNAELFRPLFNGPLLSAAAYTLACRACCPYRHDGRRNTRWSFVRSV